jgi:hypothetical protein
MTLFDIGEKPGMWFDMKGGGRVQLKTLSPGQYRKIFKATERKEPIFHEINGKATLFERVIIDDDLRRQMINDASIPSWEKLFDKAGAPIPCTTDNRELLMLMEDGTFRDFVNEKMKTLTEAEAKAIENASKN